MGEWACAAHTAQPGPLTGAAGPIVCTPSAKTMATSPRPCLTPFKALQPPPFTSRAHRRVVSSWPRSASIVLFGGRCWTDCAHARSSWMRWTQACPTMVGSFSKLQAFERHFRTDVVWTRLAPTVGSRARLLGFQSWQCRRRQSLVSLRNSSASFFFAASGFPCPCLPVPASVAVHSTSWPPPRSVLEGRCLWAVGVSPLKVPQPASVARQVPGYPPTCSFGTCQSLVTMVDDWKS